MMSESSLKEILVHCKSIDGDPHEADEPVQELVEEFHELESLRHRQRSESDARKPFISIPRISSAGSTLNDGGVFLDRLTVFL
jgi:hypothetical protein